MRRGLKSRNTSLLLDTELSVRQVRYRPLSPVRLVLHDFISAREHLRVRAKTAQYIVVGCAPTSEQVYYTVGAG